MGYDLPFFGERFIYKIDITQQDGLFTGTASEEKSEFSVDSKAVLKGYVEDDFVSFVKTYPMKFNIDHNNTIQLSKESNL